MGNSQAGDRPRPGILEMIEGGLLGVHAGDSLGATHEFKPWSDIHRPEDPGWRLRSIVGGGAFSWKPGDATDDTDLTVAVLRAYLRPEGFDLVAAADNMLAWHDGGPVDEGGATLVGLERYRSTGDPTCAGAGEGAMGNGSLMRCIPTGLVRTDPVLRAEESAAISAITHDDPNCVAACVTYNDIVADLLEGVGVEEACSRAEANSEGPVAQAIAEGGGMDLAALAAEGGNPFGGSGWVIASLTLAVAALLDPRPFPDVIADVVHLGGDTDTNGAIAGGLVGVRDGVDAIPPEWIGALQHRDEMRLSAARILDLRAEAELGS